MVWSAPRTWVAGEKPPAATMNLHIRDNLLYLFETWTTYTPTWSGTIGNGTLTARYVQIGSSVKFAIDITAGSTTNFASGSTITLPVARPSGKRINFMGIARVGSSSYPIYGDCAATSTTVTYRADPTSAGGALRNISATVPDTFTTGDTLSIAGTYEAG